MYDLGTLIIATYSINSKGVKNEYKKTWKFMAN